MFQHAIEVDSSYAAAYASLGWTYVVEWVWFWSEDPHGLERALHLAQKAVTLNAACSYAHPLLADVYLLQKRHARAIAEVKRAIALDPACAQCSVSLARILTFAGRPQEAIGLVERAMRLDPAFAAYYAADSGHAYRLLGRYEVAIAELKRALLHNPNLFFARTNLALVYNELGQGRSPGRAGKRLTVHSVCVTAKSPADDAVYRPGKSRATADRPAPGRGGVKSAEPAIGSPSISYPQISGLFPFHNVGLRKSSRGTVGIPFPPSF